MNITDQQRIMRAFADAQYGLWLDLQTGEQVWNNCGFSFEVAYVRH